MKRTTILFVTAAAMVVVSPHVATADLLLTETFDTSPLLTSPAAPFSLAFVLTDGGGSGDRNNTAMLSNFAFGGGSAGAVFLTLGGATGDLLSGVTLTDSSFFNALSSSFTPGTTLGFQLALTTKIDPGGTPDQFSVVILRSDGSPVPTTDPTGANSLLTVNIDSALPGAMRFDLVGVPEPSSFLLLIPGLAILAGMRIRRARPERVRPRSSHH